MYKKTYKELIQFSTIEERFDYLKLTGEVGYATFGSNRLLNQKFYSSKEWRDIRNEVIIRDSSCDLGILDYEIFDRATIHHINPITIDDIKDGNFEKLLDLNNLITASYTTHKAIHFGNKSMLPNTQIERMPGDTCLW